MMMNARYQTSYLHSKSGGAPRDGETDWGNWSTTRPGTAASAVGGQPIATRGDVKKSNSVVGFSSSSSGEAGSRPEENNQPSSGGGQSGPIGGGHPQHLNQSTGSQQHHPNNTEKVLNNSQSGNIRADSSNSTRGSKWQGLRPYGYNAAELGYGLNPYRNKSPYNTGGLHGTRRSGISSRSGSRSGISTGLMRSSGSRGSGVGVGVGGRSSSKGDAGLGGGRPSSKDGEMNTSHGNLGVPIPQGGAAGYTSSAGGVHSSSRSTRRTSSKSSSAAQYSGTHHGAHSSTSDSRRSLGGSAGVGSAVSTPTDSDPQTALVVGGRNIDSSRPGTTSSGVVYGRERESNRDSSVKATSSSKGFSNTLSNSSSSTHNVIISPTVHGGRGDTNVHGGDANAHGGEGDDVHIGRRSLASCASIEVVGGDPSVLGAKQGLEMDSHGSSNLGGMEINHGSHTATSPHSRCTGEKKETASITSTSSTTCGGVQKEQPSVSVSSASATHAYASTQKTTSSLYNKFYPGSGPGKGEKDFIGTNGLISGHISNASTGVGNSSSGSSPATEEKPNSSFGTTERDHRLGRQHSFLGDRGSDLTERGSELTERLVTERYTSDPLVDNGLGPDDLGTGSSIQNVGNQMWGVGGSTVSSGINPTPTASVVGSHGLATATTTAASGALSVSSGNSTATGGGINAGLYKFMEQQQQQGSSDTTTQTTTQAGTTTGRVASASRPRPPSAPRGGGRNTGTDDAFFRNATAMQNSSNSANSSNSGGSAQSGAAPEATHNSIQGTHTSSSGLFSQNGSLSFPGDNHEEHLTSAYPGAEDDGLGGSSSTSFSGVGVANSKQTYPYPSSATPSLTHVNLNTHCNHGGSGNTIGLEQEHFPSQHDMVSGGGGFGFDPHSKPDDTTSMQNHNSSSSYKEGESSYKESSNNTAALFGGGEGLGVMRLGRGSLERQGSNGGSSTMTPTPTGSSMTPGQLHIPGGWTIDMSPDQQSGMDKSGMRLDMSCSRPTSGGQSRPCSRPTSSQSGTGRKSKSKKNKGQTPGRNGSLGSGSGSCGLGDNSNSCGLENDPAAWFFENDAADHGLSPTASEVSRGFKREDMRVDSACDLEVLDMASKYSRPNSAAAAQAADGNRKLDRVAMIEAASRVLRERYYTTPTTSASQTGRPESRKGSRSRGLDGKQRANSGIFIDDGPGMENVELAFERVEEMDTATKRMKRPPSRKKDPSDPAAQGLGGGMLNQGFDGGRMKRPPSRHKEPPKALHLEADPGTTDRAEPSRAESAGLMRSSSGLGAGSRWAQVVDERGGGPSEAFPGADSGPSEAFPGSNRHTHSRNSGEERDDCAHGDDLRSSQSARGLPQARVEATPAGIPWQAATATGWMSRGAAGSSAGAMGRGADGEGSSGKVRPSSSAGLTRNNKQLHVEDLDAVPTIVCKSGKGSSSSGRMPFQSNLDRDFLQLFAS